MIAALYIDATGPYAGMAGVDAWDLERDARTFAGPGPVVAHPPCGPWGRYAWKSREDSATAIVAVRQVQRFGGVLEHPAESKLWAALNLPRPGIPRVVVGSAGDYTEETIEVRQVDFGHRAEKRTWLYIVGRTGQICLPPGQPSPPPPPPYRSGRQPRGVLETLSKRERRLTPPAFAEWLVALATTCRR